MGLKDKAGSDLKLPRRVTTPKDKTIFIESLTMEATYYLAVRA